MDISKIGTFDEFKQSTRLQLRFNDVDVLGHVNNTVYFSFYDTGKAHYFNAVRGERMNWRSVDTVIANVDCAYVSPITFSDDISVLTRCVSIGEKSFKLQQIIINERTAQLKSAAETVMVCIDPTTKQSRPLPELWRRQLEEYEGIKSQYHDKS